MRIEAAALHLFDRVAEAPELRAGVGLAVGPRLVRDGEVGEHALAVESRQTYGAQDVFGAVPAAEKAQAGHARVQRDVDPQPPPEVDAGRRKLLRLFEVRDGLGDVVVRQQERILRRRVPEDQQRRGDPAVAQLHRLVQTGHGQIVRPLGLQRPRDRKRAVAVGVGLDHAEEAAALRQGGADGPVVVTDVFQADLGPGPLFQLAHAKRPLSWNKLRLS